MPAPQRVIALCAAPVAIAGVFMTAHGLIGTLATFFKAAGNDDSVRARTMRLSDGRAARP